MCIDYLEAVIKQLETVGRRQGTEKKQYYFNMR
jgi:hypothetical protein